VKRSQQYYFIARNDLISDSERKMYQSEMEMTFLLLVGPKASGKTSLIQDLVPEEGYEFF
jgi:GTPase SAR1 family protein